ncbi:MAG: YbhB/YbcL family Raf kinase inhibitor-like protein [Candidatus Eremiobacteraeota bacterium]|nr:YbhB/YbcL family Raf kinase inhibitor-like protein [Candidatus Eremiobacteraeota bacterium]
MASAPSQTLHVRSATFAEGATVPMSAVYRGMGCEGANRSPDLNWSAQPDGTQSFAITLYDPDAPTGTGFYHWIVFNIPAGCSGLKEGAGSLKSGMLPAGAVMGHTDFGAREYGGPCPPPADPPHRYVLTVYALSVPALDSDDTTTGAKLNFMIRDSILARGAITSRYGR